MVFVERIQLKQLIMEPTKSTKTSNLLLDLIITSTPHVFTSTGVVESRIRDHFPIYSIPSTKVNTEGKAEQSIIRTRKIDLKENHGNFINDLNLIRWNVMDMFNDPNDKLYVWEELFTPIID